MKLFKKHIYIIGNSPQVDWQRTFALAVLLGISVSVYGFFFYNQIASQGIGSETPITMSESLAAKGVVATSTETIKKPVDRTKLELNQIIELYLNKKDLYQKMLDDLKKT